MSLDLPKKEGEIVLVVDRPGGSATIITFGYSSYSECWWIGENVWPAQKKN
jgi:hypothetical protein